MLSAREDVSELRDMQNAPLKATPGSQAATSLTHLLGKEQKQRLHIGETETPY